MTREDKQNQLISLLHEIKKYERLKDYPMVGLLESEYNRVLHLREDSNEKSDNLGFDIDHYV